MQKERAFADDLLIFCKPTEATLRIIRDCLLEFGCESGLKANSAKSKVFFGGLGAVQKAELGDILGIGPGSFPIRYLGLPLRLLTRLLL